MGWTIAMLFFCTVLTTFAIGSLIWLRRPARPRGRPLAGCLVKWRFGESTAESGELDRSESTSYLPYEMLGFSAPSVAEPTEYIPADRLPVASGEDPTAYMSFAELARALEPEPALLDIPPSAPIGPVDGEALDRLREPLDLADR